MPDWGNYNGTYPVIPTSVGLEAGDGVCLVDYSLPATAPAEGSEEEQAESYHTFQVPVFFGLVNAGFGSLWRWVRGLTISQTAGEKMEVYVAPSMYADFTPDTVEGKVKVCDCPLTQSYIKKKSYNGLCCMPTEVGGSASTYFCDYFYNNAASATGFRVRAAGGSAAMARMRVLLTRLRTTRLRLRFRTTRRPSAFSRKTRKSNKTKTGRSPNENNRSLKFCA